MTPTWGEKDIMYEAINITAASRTAERVNVDGARVPLNVALRILGATVKSRSGRRTEPARASSGNLH